MPDRGASVRAEHAHLDEEPVAMEDAALDVEAFDPQEVLARVMRTVIVVGGDEAIEIVDNKDLEAAKRDARVTAEEVL